MNNNIYDVFSTLSKKMDHTINVMISEIKKNPESEANVIALAAEFQKRIKILIATLKHVPQYLYAIDNNNIIHDKHISDVKMLEKKGVTVENLLERYDDIVETLMSSGSAKVIIPIDSKKITASSIRVGGNKIIITIAHGTKKFTLSHDKIKEITRSKKIPLELYSNNDNVLTLLYEIIF